MFEMTANGILLGPKNQKLAFWGFLEIFDLKLKVLRMKTQCVKSSCQKFVSSVLSSGNQCPKTLYFKQFTYINVHLFKVFQHHLEFMFTNVKFEKS